MSLRAMLRNTRRRQGYAHDKDDYRLELEPIHPHTLESLLKRGEEIGRLAGKSIVLSTPEDVNTFEKVNLFDLDEASARFLLGDVVYEDLVQAVPFAPRGGTFTVTAIDGKKRVIELQKKGAIQIGG